MISASLEPTQADLANLFQIKHGPPANAGWGPKTRLAFDYFNPDDRYEALLNKLIDKHTKWLDVGCGRNIFPSNAPLAQMLADRCRLLVGVDPDDNVEDNPALHIKIKEKLEAFESETTFDVITMRMVVEHVTDPTRFVAKLAALTHPGSKVVVYTVNKWSPVPLMTRLIPESMRDLLKRYLWSAEERDTFPVAYLMNTKRQLRPLFHESRFQECHFTYLDDCRTLGRWRRLLRAELRLRQLLRMVGLRYPESCLLAVYERQ